MLPKKMDYLKKMMSKNGWAAMRLAEELLLKNPDDRLATIEFYSNQFKVGRGTIQNAIKTLTDIGAIVLEPHGHKGTFIKSMNYKKLLNLSGTNSIAGSMPLPYSLLLQGLATGLYSVFSNSDIEFNMMFLRGSQKRFELLKEEKVDFIVTSYAAAKSMIADDDFVILTEFSDHTYVSGRVLIFRDKKVSRIENGMRVAIDDSSYDQSVLTRMICKNLDVEYVQISYNQITNLLNSNKIDAAVWNIDDLLGKNINMNVVPLDTPSFKDQKAVLVGLSMNVGINSLIKKVVDKKSVEFVQAQVVNKQTVPTY